MPFDLRWQSVVDFAVLAAAIYPLLRWSQNARALRVTLGILVLETAALVSRQIDLWITAWILHATALGAGVTLIVLFQPELRHALNQLEIRLSWPERRMQSQWGSRRLRPRPSRSQRRAAVRSSC